MRIKIKSASKKVWYYNKKDNIFDVIKEYDELYEVKNGNASGFFVNKSDAKIIKKSDKKNNIIERINEIWNSGRW